MKYAFVILICNIITEYFKPKFFIHNIYDKNIYKLQHVITATREWILQHHWGIVRFMKFKPVQYVFLQMVYINVCIERERERDYAVQHVFSRSRMSKLRGWSGPNTQEKL